MELLTQSYTTAESNFHQNIIKETDILFLVLQRVLKANSLTVKLSYKEILNSIGRLDCNYTDLSRTINSLKKKVFQEEIVYTTESGGIINFMLFTMVQNEPSLGILILKTQQEIMPIITELATFFSSEDLSNYLHLKTSYSKAMFRLVKKNSSNKRFTVSLTEIKKIIGIATDYPDKNIYSRIMKPSQAELLMFFPELQILPIRAGDAAGSKKIVHGKGSKIIGYHVNF